MADKVTKKSNFDGKALKVAIRDVNKNKEAAAEANGRAGQSTKDACERNNWNKKAFTLVAGLAKKEPAQQLEVLGAVVTYAAAMGMFDGSDMFHDHIKAFQDVIDSATQGKAAATPGSAMVAGLSGGASPH